MLTLEAALPSLPIDPVVVIDQTTGHAMCPGKVWAMVRERPASNRDLVAALAERIRRFVNGIEPRTPNPSFLGCYHAVLGEGMAKDFELAHNALLGAKSPYADKAERLWREFEAALDDLDAAVQELREPKDGPAVVRQWERMRQAERETENGPPPGCTHTADFSTVTWYGERFDFNETEAKCVAALWAEWEKDPDDRAGLLQRTIGRAINSDNADFRLIHVFRHKGRLNPAWGRMIHSPGNGKFYLGKPIKPTTKRRANKKPTKSQKKSRIPE